MPQLIVPSLAIPGTSLFSDGLLPPMLGQQRSVQKNEPHPKSTHALILLCFLFILADGNVSHPFDRFPVTLCRPLS